jgi:hypothetical protein
MLAQPNKDMHVWSTKSLSSKRMGPAKVSKNRVTMLKTKVEESKLISSSTLLLFGFLIIKNVNLLNFRVDLF